MIAGILSAFHVKRPVDAIEGDHFSEWLVVLPPELIALAQLDFLGRIPIAVNRATCRLALLVENWPNQLHVLKSRDSLGLVEEFVFRQLAQPEELPPLSLLLSMVRVDEVREQPPRVRRMFGIRAAAGSPVSTLPAKFDGSLGAVRDLGIVVLRRSRRGTSPARATMLRAPLLEPLPQIYVDSTSSRL